MLATGLEQSVARHPEWALRTHEQICTDPEGQFRRPFGDLGLDWNKQARAVVADHDRPGSGFRTQRVAADLPDDWKTRLTPHQAAEMKRVLSWFPLQRWSDEDLSLTPDG